MTDLPPITTPEEFTNLQKFQQWKPMDNPFNKTDTPSKPTWEVPLEDPEKLRVDDPVTWAGGIPAIATSLKASV